MRRYSGCRMQTHNRVPVFWHYFEDTLTIGVWTNIQNAECKHTTVCPFSNIILKIIWQLECEQIYRMQNANTTPPTQCTNCFERDLTRGARGHIQNAGCKHDTVHMVLTIFWRWFGNRSMRKYTECTVQTRHRVLGSHNIFRMVQKQEYEKIVK